MKKMARELSDDALTCCRQAGSIPAKTSLTNSPCLIDAPEIVHRAWYPLRFPGICFGESTNPTLNSLHKVNISLNIIINVLPESVQALSPLRAT